MAEFIEAPMEPLQTIIDEIGKTRRKALAEAPKLTDLTGFPQFLQSLKNQGMHPYLMGDFAIDAGMPESQEPKPKPYLIK
mgnify:FL=1